MVMDIWEVTTQDLLFPKLLTSNFLKDKTTHNTGVCKLLPLDCESISVIPNIQTLK